MYPNDLLEIDYLLLKVVRDDSLAIKVHDFESVPGESESERTRTANSNRSKCWRLVDWRLGSRDNATVNKLIILNAKTCATYY